MAKPKVVLNRSGVRGVLSDPGVQAELEQRMARVEAQAKSNAPVATGAYRDSITTRVVHRGDRVVVQVVAEADYAFAVEANTGNLSRALDSAGGE